MLTEENYFSVENNMKYTGSSQIKSFMKCEKETLAELLGNWNNETSKAMMVSSYIDNAISGTLDDFKAKNPEIFLKSGELKADYKLAEDVLNQIKQDEFFMKYLNGDHQTILTGKISDVPVKIKIDSYHENKVIVDLKCIANLKPIWNEKTRQKENFIDYYDYVLQGALYQEIVRQNTGKKLPFIIAVATKEKISRKAVLQIPQEKLDLKLQFLQEYLPHLQKVKNQEIAPTGCGECDYCASIKKCDRIYYYEDYFEKEN